MDLLVQLLILLLVIILIYLVSNFIDRRVQINLMIWLILFLILNVFDATTTYILSQKAGWDIEANPIIRFFVSHLGSLYGLIAVKAVGCILISYLVICERKSQTIKKFMIFAFSMYSVVVINNTLILFLLA